MNLRTEQRLAIDIGVSWRKRRGRRSHPAPGGAGRLMAPGYGTDYRHRSSRFQACRKIQRSVGTSSFTSVALGVLAQRGRKLRRGADTAGASPRQHLTLPRAYTSAVRAMPGFVADHSQARVSGSRIRHFAHGASRRINELSDRQRLAKNIARCPTVGRRTSSRITGGTGNCSPPCPRRQSRVTKEQVIHHHMQAHRDAGNNSPCDAGLCCRGSSRASGSPLPPPPIPARRQTPPCRPVRSEACCRGDFLQVARVLATGGLAKRPFEVIVAGPLA